MVVQIGAMSHFNFNAVPGVTRVSAGQGTWAPVVLDSPHSGARYPGDFGHSAPFERLRAGEDMHVERLFAPGASGAIMIAADFPRTYIDPNRPLADVDVSMLGEAWPEPHSPSAKSALGKGLIWRELSDGTPIYSRLLSVAEVRKRIRDYWQPYRQLLSRVLDHTHARAGVVWHINCHSMPSYWPAGMPGGGTPVEADILLGNRDGQTCGEPLIALAQRVFSDHGYRVAVNDRFKGVDIVACSGDPVGSRHSLQIEIVRRCYMDEHTYEVHDGFDTVRHAIEELNRALCEQVA